jgi:predicted lysophospholipase L1 biosynthesis ABC-type transport system permease subunit
VQHVAIQEQHRAEHLVLLLLTVLGVVIGLGVSAMLARAVPAIIFGVAPRDPLTYGVTAAVLVVALAACSVPARRADASDPVVLLRREPVSCRTTCGSALRTMHVLLGQEDVQ